MKKLVIMRGVPGSGKSTEAEKMVKEYCEDMDDWTLGVVCSADKYFVRPDGVYDFSFKTLKNAHKWCRGTAEKWMSKDLGAADLIVIDNTNTRLWEYETYLDLAKQYGYTVELKVVGKMDRITGKFNRDSVKEYAERNSHGVPVDKVIEMAERFEF